MAASGLLELLTQKMGYLTQRQSVIADNIANANTPHFLPKDLVSFSQAMQQAESGQGGNGLRMAVTSGGHLGGTHGAMGLFKTETEKDIYEIKPNGNAVVLEQQMTNLAQNYTDYSVVTGLYHQTISMIKTALSRTS